MAEIESERDRLAYLQAFGEPATFERGELLGIFDAAYIDANSVDEAAPMLEVRASDVKLLGVGKGASFSFRGFGYRVRRVESDGTGMAKLILEG